MPAPTGIRIAESYISQLVSAVCDAVKRLVRAPSHSRKAEARRRMARYWLILSFAVACAILALMFLADAAVIGLMPPRRSPDLWPLRIFTELAKGWYVIFAVAACLLITLLLVPRLQCVSRTILVSLGQRIQFILLSVIVSDIAVEILKPVFGRGRPFVGDIGVMNFSPFEGTQAFASLPSSHASTAWALALAVSFVWPRLAPAMWTYAILMCITRVVLLAHHPSDVVAGALVAAIGTMFVRYWFAARHLVFRIGANGAITTLETPSWASLKRVARSAVAP